MAAGCAAVLGLLVLCCQYSQLSLGEKITSQQEAHLRSGGRHVSQPIPTGTDRMFKLFEEEELRRGVCLDGTAPAYYFRPGFGDGRRKFVIYYEGGGWCTSDADCLFRSKTMLGSSKEYWPWMRIIDMPGGYLSDHRSSNPTFYDWNAIVFRYCDGASFSGNVSEPIAVGNQTIYYRGAVVNEALMKHVIENQGLRNATDVVISGCSAGALAVYLHIDSWTEALEDTGVRVRGLADSGFFINENMNSCRLGSGLKHVMTRQNTEPALPKACVEAHKAEGNTYRCFFAQYVLPYIKTPIFSSMSRYDTSYIRGGGCKDEHDVDDINDLGDTLYVHWRTTLELAATNVSHGWLLDACPRHCGIEGFGATSIVDYWNHASGPSGRSTRQIFEAWYDEDGEPHFWREEATTLYPNPKCG